jgi:toxin ParE1/3/4
MKIRYSRSAAKQISEIYNYVAEDNRAAADRFVRRVERLAALVADFPGIGRPADEPGVRVIGLRPFPYLMFYSVAENATELHILQISHMARQRRPT